LLGVDNQSVKKLELLKTEDEECAECFASYFHSVYSPSRPRLDPREAERGYMLANLLLVTFALRFPLLHVFNRCLKECHYTDRWKTTRVIPVPKGSGGADVSGYRPITVLSAFAKVFESVLHTCIYSQVNARLTDVQHGFRPGRSNPILHFFGGEPGKQSLPPGVHHFGKRSLRRQNGLSTSDCERLQGDIDRLVLWSESNKLRFNVSKCCVVSYSRARALLLHLYEVAGEVLLRAT
ncbi:reverse transcriptase, partial [Operophtera brumata]